MAATALEIYKAQAQVLVPVVRELKAQIGEAKTHEIIRKALGDHFRNFGKAAFPTMKGENFGEKVHSLMNMFATEGALDWNINQKTDEELNFTVTGCRYAEFYQQLGAPDLGFMLVCGQDYPFTEGMDERAVLERATTIMQGNGRGLHKITSRKRPDSLSTQGVPGALESCAMNYCPRRPPNGRVSR